MIRVRIPPSPTGLLHIGTARTALYNFLFAKKHGGKIVLRMEDTDKERSHKEYEDDIIKGLNALGLIADEGVFRQSERTDVYVDGLKKLVGENKAYYCFCTKERLDGMRNEQTAKKLPPRYDGMCSQLDPKESAKRAANGEPAVIRLRIPPSHGIKWNDLVRGEVTIHSGELDDFVIARRIDDPLYNLTVVTDDHDMKITHVIRGEDHIPNTPKQILIYQAFGWKIPEFAHLPLILNEDRSKMSKRKNKTSVDDYLRDGYLPEALLNFIALLGWNPGTEEEIFTMQELIDRFSLDRVHKGGAVWDPKRLDWINGEHIRRAIEEDANAFCKRHADFIQNEDPMVAKILRDPDFEGRFKKLSEIPEAIGVFFTGLPEYDESLLLNEKFKIDHRILKTVLTHAMKKIEGLNWEKGDSGAAAELSGAMVELIEELSLKTGQVLWPIRAALSGTEKSPNFATLMVYLGKKETIRRLEFAVSKA